MGKNACLLFAMLLVLGVAGWCLKDLRHAGTGKSKAALSAQFLSACDDADVATADHILSGGLDANERDPSGTPLLCYAAISGHTDIVNCLIQHGAKVNDRSAHGYTALMLAAQGNHSQAVETLLFNGADRELKTNVGMTAFDIAVANQAIGCMRLLSPADQFGIAAKSSPKTISETVR